MKNRSLLAKIDHAEVDLGAQFGRTFFQSFNHNAWEACQSGSHIVLCFLTDFTRGMAASSGAS